VGETRIWWSAMLESPRRYDGTIYKNMHHRPGASLLRLPATTGENYRYLDSTS